ncbi:hypothetical protein PU560_17065 [Georgenia sp. 10Sc9-8]|uniref:DUF2157 domain-containing protein n=1 Tax=Georgenia halotolerans TaxID=3028317 RepID=A0ABT5U1E8_9MICO|nr:hypothetical protein [Georgenia halotolerans]
MGSRQADAGGDSAGDGGHAPLARRHLLLRWGLPRDPRASEHLLGFVLTTVLTVVVTRGYLQLAGFPQIGGGGLHVAHVLWGGLAMALAMVLVLSFAGPVVRPLAAFLGGIGFGLFIDEVGKFLTQDNDYFYRPAPMIMYATLVLLMIGADALHGRREHHPSEHLAGAADHAVAGLVGGLSPRRRAVAEDLLAQGRGARGSAETEALLAAIPDDDAEVPDPFQAVTIKVRELLHAVVTRRWATGVTAGLFVVLVAGGAGTLALSWAGDSGPGWARTTALVSLVVMVAVAARGWSVLSADEYRGLQWMRRAVLVNLLITQVALFRLDPWLAAAGLAVALLALGVIAAEKLRLERLHEGGAY